MTSNNYLNLFLDAGITDHHHQARYSTYIDLVLSEEGIDVDDIIGIAEKGTGGKPDLYVVHRQAIAFVSSYTGVFGKKPLNVAHIAPIAAIGRLRGTQEGFKGTDVTITANDADGGELFKIVWGLGGPDWVEPLIMRQRERLFKVISEAMDRLAEAPAPAAGVIGHVKGRRSDGLGH